MKKWRIVLVVTITLLTLLWKPPLWADVRQDTGFDQLATELGSAMPTGDSVLVTQVEAVSDSSWMPDTTASQFSGKTITDKTGGGGVSSHAHTVALNYYGDGVAIAPGIASVDVYAALWNDTSDFPIGWLNYGFLMYGLSLGGQPLQPAYLFSTSAAQRVLASPSRVANHSWVADSENSAVHNDFLRRIDYIVAADDFIQVVGLNNGSVQKPLLSSAFNALTVGRTDAYHPIGTAAVDSIYTGGRASPLIVAPYSPTSYAAPIAAAAAAILVETGHNPVLSNDPAQTATTDRSGRTIYNAERAEAVMAALLAGACRLTDNSIAAEITDYRGDAAYCTNNGLDTRFGAGQLNIYNSYHIIAGGEQNSAEDDATGGGSIDAAGFDVDPIFGGASGSNSTASYHFTADTSHRRIYASLVWHLTVDGGTWDSFDGSAVLHDLNLALYDETVPGHDRLVAVSDDDQNNSEHLWTSLVPGRSYRMEVTVGPNQSSFSLDYALAWRMGTPADQDLDGMDDEWEVQFGLDYTDAGDGTSDTDGDGLSAAEEYAAGTWPDIVDTDDDGAADGLEITFGGDPLDPTIVPEVQAVPVGNSATTAAAFALTALGLQYFRRRRFK